MATASHTAALRAEYLDRIIPHDGDAWRIVGIGATNDEGRTYCHLASTTRAIEQRNGPRPIQKVDWLDLKGA